MAFLNVAAFILAFACAILVALMVLGILYGGVTGNPFFASVGCWFADLVFLATVLIAYSMQSYLCLFGVAGLMAEACLIYDICMEDKEKKEFYSKIRKDKVQKEDEENTAATAEAIKIAEEITAEMEKRIMQPEQNTVQAAKPAVQEQTV